MTIGWRGRSERSYFSVGSLALPAATPSSSNAQIRPDRGARQDSNSTADAWAKPSRRLRPQAPLLRVAAALPPPDAA
jgi:hypothetical protein